MFGSRKQPPPFCPTNADRLGTSGSVAFSNAERNWTEHFDLIEQAAAALASHGRSVVRHKTWLEQGDSGFAILPQLVEIQPLERGGVRTVTTMQVNHPTLIPHGVFEYQHSTGDSIVDSLTSGFDQWMQTDFVTLLDALRVKPEACTTMEMTFPAENGRPGRVRRAVLGPVAHTAEKTPDRPEEHPFCPCCLLTNSFEAFRSLIEADGFHGVRLFALRDSDGKPAADCRVNGDDWEAGEEALRAYAGTWPPLGYEFRKQYVVLQNWEQTSRAASSQA